MLSKEIQMAQLIWQIRRVFQRLGHEANELLIPLNVTASQRAVLEFLDIHEPETLANMARSHDVSRQHIQQLVNDLLEKQLVESIENPNHKRSFLVQRTEAGRKLFTVIRKTETELFKNIAKEFQSNEIQTSLNTLKKFNDLLHSEHWEKIKRQLIVKEK